VVIGLAFDDGAGTINLLCKGEAYHLMRECHLGK
jgi:hypothetical protein